MIISLTRQVIFLIPSFIILPKFFGLKGVWYAGPIADLLAVTLSGIIIFKEMKHLKQLESKARPIGYEGYEENVA